jgi:hypothetical protein
MDHARRAAIFVALLALASNMARGQEWKTSSSGLNYSISIEPFRPRAGALSVVELSVEGISASSSRVDEFRLGSGLALESESIRPIVSASARGTAFRFELRVLEAGDYRIDSLAIVAAEGDLRLGPIIVRGTSSESHESTGARRRVVPPLSAFDPRSGTTKLEVPALDLRVGHAASPARRPVPEDGGRALAELYGALRRAPPLSREARAARKAALVRASELGTDPPLLDALPPPAYFFWPAFAVALTGLSLFSVSRIRARKARSEAPLGRAALAAGGALLALCIALCSFGLASAAERKEGFAVIWTDSLLTVPFAAAEHPVAVVRGSTARTRGSFGAFESVALGDGVEGWALRVSLFRY